MPLPTRLLGSGFPLRNFAVALVVVGLAGCSGNVTRFDENPFREKPEATSSPSRKAAVVPEQRGGHWSWDGGTALTLAPSDTLDGIAHRYHVPAAAIIQVNNLIEPNAIRAGQRLVVPKYHPEPAPRSASAPALGTTVTAQPKLGFKITTQSAKAPTIVATMPGENLTNGTSRIRFAKVIPIPKPNVRRMIARELSQKARKLAMVGRPGVEDSVGSINDNAPSFQWPAHGQILRHFGPQPDGQRDDGVDVAVPEDTPIKAASDGTVIYAGNELKGLGNLVLVRHTNNYVTAYAHAKELRVKRGDPIKQGDVIGISGQTEEFETSQFHFEIRRDSAPVDPLHFLQGA